jgi:hypothetical protein
VRRSTATGNHYGYCRREQATKQGSALEPPELLKANRNKATGTIDRQSISYKLLVYQYIMQFY